MLAKLYRLMAVTVAIVCLTISSAESGKAENLSYYGRPKVINISHRGASGHAPEHTMAAYGLGTLMHGDYIEIDLQMSTDGELISMHDDSIDRTTNKKGLIKEFTLEELKQLDAC